MAVQDTHTAIHRSSLNESPEKTSLKLKKPLLKEDSLFCQDESPDMLIAHVGILVLIVCLLLATGCQSSMAPRVHTAELSGPSVLLLPPVLAQANHQRARELGNDFYTEIVTCVQSPVVYAPQVAELAQASRWENLYSEGVLDKTEAQSMGRIAGCQRILVPHIQKLPDYPPFRAVITLTLIDAESGNALSHRMIDLDLSRKDTAADYKQFINEHNLSDSETGMQQAQLSVSLFQHYLACRAASSLM